ncbi:uncharacterized protein LOC119995857 [Tripterygium wilfordii]|uniref:uncharacterized protein LOC119995857 n=1 Tax=Tripterygium wilfordii TaxID=458696 RepID=UPI0018F860EE|nr:uncharacterized protein LOC119995857 [Tripterygium wilfordii]
METECSCPISVVALEGCLEYLAYKRKVVNVLHLSNDQQVCPICNSEKETLIHLMTSCSIPSLVWSNSRWHIDSHDLARHGVSGWAKVVLNPLLFGLCKEDWQEFQLLALVTFDQTWRYRNELIHGAMRKPESELVCQIQQLHTRHCQAWRLPAYLHVRLDLNWLPPSSNWIKVNFDTAMGQNLTSSAAIARSSSGGILFASVYSGPRVDPTVGEAMALRIGVQSCLNLDLQEIQFEGDSLIVINAVSQPDLVCQWKIENVIEDISLNLNEIRSWTISKVSRHQNAWADTFAKWAAARRLSGSIPSPFISEFQCWLDSGHDPPDHYLGLDWCGF